MRIQSGLVMVMVAALLGSCAQNPATGQVGLNLVSKSQERAIGQQTAEAHLKQYGLYKPGSAATTYVTNLCQRMYAVTEVAADPVSCILLDSDQFNAWATPGYINVYRGLLPFVQSEAQLAAVLGHEAGHIAAQHISRGVTNQMIGGILVSAVGLYIASQGHDQTAQTAVQLGSLAAGLAVAKYGRDFERQADELGQRYLPRAGYDPREEVGMIESMRGYEAYASQFALALRGDEADRGDWYAKLTSSHPATPERVQDALTRTGAPDGSVRLPEGVSPATPASDPQGRNRFLNAIDGLAWGPHREWGIAGRTYIALPAARVVVRIPDGFVKEYVEGSEKPENGQWWGRHPVSDVRFKMGVDKLKAGMNAGNVLADVGVGNIQRLVVDGGREAFTGTKTGNGLVYRAVAIPSPETDRVVVMVYNFPDAATQAREEAALMTSIQQSRIVGEAEAKRWQPLQVKVRTVAAGDTSAKLANVMPVGTLRDELFRALNTLEPGQNPAVGSRVKVVSDPNQL